MIKLIKTSLLFFTVFASAATHAWTIIDSESTISFITIKKNNIGETHFLSGVSGAINEGIARVIIKPDSVESRVPIRNERMREFLFNTKLYPTIEITAQIDDVLKTLDAGKSQRISLPAHVSMHGQTEQLELNVRASLLNKNTLIVTTIHPVLVRAASFDMVEGIRKLSSLVNGLPIAESVPVSFSLMFKHAL